MKNKLCLILFALFAGTLSAKAQTTNLTAANGWTQITELPAAANLNDYFFVFSDSEGSGLGMVLGPGKNNGAANKTMIFTENFDPMTHKAALWTMAQDGEYNIITGVADPEFMLQTEDKKQWLFHTNDNGGGNLTWGYVKPAYNGSWTIQNGKYPESGYLGAWNAIEEGDEIAANVPLEDVRVAHFNIFASKRGKYVENVETTHSQLCTDISYILTNAEATRHSMVGWTLENTGTLSNDYIFQTINNGELSNASKDWFFEAWQRNGNLSDRQMSQTFTEMPAGRYTLSVRTDAADEGAYLFIKDVTNDSEQTIQLSAHTGGAVRVELELTVSSTMQLGVRLDGYQSNWVKFDDFRLSYSKPITEIATTAEDLNDYFFVFRDHANPNLGLVLGQGANQGVDYKTMYYSNACSPMTNLGSIWTIAKWGDNTLVTSPSYPEFILQTEKNNPWFYRTHDNGGGAMDWGNAILSLADAASGWTIQNGKYPDRGYLGPWADAFVDGAEVAFNKTTEANIGHFDIYEIKRGEYVTRVETEKAKLAPIDISYIITNAEATRAGNTKPEVHGNTVGWTLNMENGFWTQVNNDMSNKSGTWYFEAWNATNLSNRKMSQTFTEMPDGQYTLSIRTRPEHTGTGAYLFINDERADFTGKDPNGVVTVVANVTGGTLSIGVELENCRTNWVSFDKFELTWSLVPTSVGEGRYLLKNCGRNCYLKHGTDDNLQKTAASQYLDGRAAAWDFVRSAFPNQYYIRNVENGTYLQWTTENNGKNLPLVADPLDATLFSFDTNTHVHEGCVSIRIIGADNKKPYLNAFGNDGRLGNYSSDEQSDWILFPVSEPMPEVDTEYLIINKESGKYATSAGADAQLVQNEEGDVNADNSVWTLATSDTGFKIANAGVQYKNLATVTAPGTFTTDGVTWYIEKVSTDISHFNISTSTDLSGSTCWHNNGGNTIDYSNADNNPGSRWRFVPVEEYYQNGLAYLASLYSEENKNNPFYLSETAYNNLKTVAHTTAAEKIAAANAMFHILDNIIDVINMPEDGADYLIRNVGLANHYVCTDDNTKLVLGTSYNSTYFWHVERDGANNAFRLRQCCYEPTYSGNDPLQYKEDRRYIKHEQPTANQGEWEYEATQNSFPVSFDFYETAQHPLFGSASVLVGESRMNAYDVNSNVITWQDKDDWCKWEFITVEQASQLLIAAAEKAYEAESSGPFTLTAEAKAEIRTAIDNLMDNYNYQNYWILENLLNAPDSYAALPDGRYLVRNYNYDYTRDGTPEDTETYLTALTNTMGVVEEALNYWSIWDVIKTADGYTMQCEGDRLIHAPGKPLDGNPGTEERDNGFLYYAGIINGNDQYGVGNTAEQTLYISPALSLQLGNVASPVVGSYASISSKEYPTKYLYQWTVGIGGWIDNVVYAKEYEPNNNNAAWKTAFLWEFIPLTAEREAAIFQNQVDGLAGYVGGVVTLTDVESVPCLQDIVDLRDAAIMAIKNGSTLAYTAPTDYENLTVNDANEVGPQAYRAILDKINDIKRNPETKKYYQDLRPMETLDNGKEVKHPFFMENFSGTRPSYGARLTEGDGDAWQTRPKNEVVDNAGAFYVNRTRDESIDANGIVTQEAQYQLLNGNGYSLDHRSNTPSEHFSINRTLGDDKMTFEIEPVIPGVWKMRDAEVEEGFWPYVTVTAQYGQSGGLQYYNRVEVSTLWKFQTFNELDTIFVRVAPTATADGSYFCTYSNTLNIEVPVEDNPVPYYCSAAYYHRDNGDPQASTALKVVLTEMPHDGSNYYLKHDAGYMFMTKSGTNINREDGNPRYNPSYPNAVYIADAKYMKGSIDRFIAGDEDTRRPAYEDNLFVGNAKWPIEITTENWRNIYALGYAAGDTQVGIYHGVPVMGRGMGFYHIKLGGVLKVGSAYIPSKAFSDEDGDFSPINALEVHESGMPVEILFEDENGNMVDRMELTSDGTMRHLADGPIYDLAGRQVTNPTHGIYIQNGRKAYYK